MKANNEKTELALKQASTEVSTFVLDVEKEVANIESKYSAVVPDCSNREGYTFSKSVRGEVMPVRSAIEKARKSLKEPVLEMGKLIDSSLKPLMQRLEEVYKPHEEAYRQKDNEKKIREEARQAKIQSAFDAMNSAAMDSIGQSSAVIETVIDDLADFDFDPDVFMEKTEQAVRHHAEVMDKLSVMLNAQLAAEEFQKKQDEMAEREAAIKQKEDNAAYIIQKEIDDKERSDRDAEIRKQVAIDAEEKHSAQIEQNKLEAEQRQVEAIEKERAEVQRQKDIEIEAERKRAANTKHKTAVNNQIKDAIMLVGITEDQAKSIIKMAAKGQCGNMRVSY